MNQINQILIRWTLCFCMAFLAQSAFAAEELAPLNIDSSPQIIEAARNGDVDAMKKSLSSTEVDNDDCSIALFTAVQEDHVEIVKLLLESKPAIIDMQSSLGVTALHYAASAGFAKIVEVLINHGARKDLKTQTLGLTALDMAKSTQHESVIRLLSTGMI